MTAAKIAATGTASGVLGAPPQSFLARIFSTGAFPIVLSVLLFQFIGFQYSAYIAGEVRGNVRRGVLIALLGALLIGVLANSVYVDAISSHFGFNTNVAWGAGYWGWAHSISPLPLGQPNAMPLLAVVANKSLWPLWALISLGGVVFPFLLCPVYINFISRMQLAWSLDRQMPEWFGRVNERLRAPLNAILATLGLTAVFLFFQSYKDLPTFLATTDHKLNLAGTAWFSIVMALFTWCLPGFNAILVRWRRPDLVRNAPFGKKLPWIGLAWLVFPLWIYVFAVVKPIVNALKAGGALTYLETNGIIDAAVLLPDRPHHLLHHALPRPRGRRGREDAVHRAPTGLVADDRLYIASDLHAAEKAWRKFVNAIKLNVYKADAALLAGDLTGKAIVPIIEPDAARPRRPLQHRSVRRAPHRPRGRGAGRAGARHRRRGLLLVRDHRGGGRAAVG